MAAFSPILMRSVSGGKSWASVVANGAKVVAVAKEAKAKKVSWQDGAWNLGVETRVYIADEDHPEFEHTTREQKVSLTKYWDGVDRGGKTALLKHVPYRPGEMKERTVVIDGKVHGDRIGFSQMTRKDGSELTSTIFGRLVTKFFEGVPAPDEGGLVRTTNVGKLSPDFFKTGAGKEYVGRESLRLMIEEALKTIEGGGKFEMIKETCSLLPQHTPSIERFQDAYYSAVVTARKREQLGGIAAQMKEKSMLNAGAVEFVPKTRGCDDWGRVWIPEKISGGPDLLENKAAPRVLMYEAPPILSDGLRQGWT